MEYFISTDKSRLNIEQIHEYICKKSYWGVDRTMEETRATIANCLCFGLYSGQSDQLGFVRVVTDYTFFGYIMDFIVFEQYQGIGYGKKLVEFMLNHQVLKKLNTIALKTRDAHSFYERYGFKKIADSPLWMAIDKQKFI